MITGYILAPATGSVTFKIRSDDGFYMKVDGTEVISSWKDQGASPVGSYDGTSTAINLVEGRIYPVRAFYHQTSGSAEAHLYWNYGSGDQLIPQSNLGLTASDLGTGCAVGESQYCPADNARQIKAINGTNTNGKYWINVGGVSTNTYTLMDSNIDGGGWMLGMKGVTNSQGNSTGLGYDATQWTSTALLQSGSDKNAPLKTNQGQTCSSGNGVTCATGDDANAKNDVFNYSAATEALVVWPDLTSRSDGFRYTGASTYGFTWKESLTSSSTYVNNVTNGYNSSYGCPSTAVTLLNLFSNALRCKVRNANSTSPYDARGATVFSYQNDVNFFGFNYRGVGDVKKARFGFGWNENGGAQENSNDVVGGLGIGGTYNPTYGAGDYIGCCATSNGINRQAGFEFYVRNSSLGVTGSATASATYGTASTPWTASSPGYSSGASLQKYIVKPIGSGVDVSKISINASTGAVSVTSGIAGGTYNLSVSLIDTYGQVASTKFTLTVKDAGLTALTLTTGTLSPVFDKGTFSYTATVPYSTTGISVTPTGALSTSTYQTNVNSAGYTAGLWTGTASFNLPLNYGSNTILILVTATDGVTTKTYTLTVTREGPPEAPTSLSATAGDGQASISFTAGAINGNAITNYKYSLDGLSYIAFSPAVTASPVVVTGLTNGTAYTIYLKAVSAAGDSVASTSVAVTPKTSPSAPTGLSATVGNGQLSISFTEGATGGSAITNYKYSLDGFAYTALSPADATSPVTIPSLSNGTSYTVYLKAVNVVGDGLASESVTGIPNIVPTVSSAPVVSGTARQGQTLSVTNGIWANGPTSYSYSWSRATTSGGTYTTISGATSSSYTLGAADVGNFIKASVIATNSAGNSTASTSAATAAAVTATCSPSSSTIDSAYTVLSFTSVGTCFWNVPTGVTTADVLVVGGGGGGAGTYTTGTGGSGGGGGGGGAYFANAVPLTPTQLLQLVIGAGGSGGITTNLRPGSEGSPGGDSAFTTLTAGGGGGGGCATTTSNNVVCTHSSMAGRAGTAGGSGGGATPPWNAYNWGAAGVGSSVTIGGTTFAGQTGYIGAIYNGGAGSGGGARGAATTSAVGAGLSSTIAGNAVEYGRGGRGSNQSGTSFNATTSGYGNGGDGAVVAASPGAAGAAGAQGIVVVRYVSTYTVTYSYNSADGGNSITTATFSPGGTAIILPTPTRTGYVFKGWYTASTGGSLVGDAGANYTPTGTTAAITIEAQWNSSNATLSALALTAGTISPTFDKDVISYTASVKNSITSITITPTKGDSNATFVQYLGASGTTAFTGPISVGANVIRTIVTAQDGTIKTYTVTVTRATAISFINTLTAPAGVATVAYQGVTFTAATGGTGSFTYTYSINNVVNAALPAGLVFSGANRSITGTPTVAATTGTIRVIATDTNGDVYTMTTGFTISISSSSQLPISIATRYGTAGQTLYLGIQGGSGTGALTFAETPDSAYCSISGSTLTANFGAGASGTCYVTATRAADAAFTSASSSATAIFFTAYVPVITQTMTCPAGTVPSNPTGIGVGSCLQVLAPVSTNSGDTGAAPKITALSLATGLVGASIVITGTGFSSATKVQFGSKSTNTFTKTSTTITVNVPTGATTGRVMVFSPTGTAMASQVFTVIQPDTRAPAFLSGNVNTSTPTQINLNFDENLTATSTAPGAFGVSVAGVTRSVSTVTISGTTITLTLSSAVTTGQAVVFTYTNPGDATSIQDAAGNKTATITATALANTL